MILINGVVEILWNQFGQNGSYLLCLIFSCGVVFVSVRIWQNARRMQKGIFEVIIVDEGVHVQSRGLYDSGNRLKDPYTAKGVYIISQQLLDRLWREQNSASIKKEKVVYSPEDLLSILLLKN
jgi:hypothetical protein